MRGNLVGRDASTGWRGSPAAEHDHFGCALAPEKAWTEVEGFLNSGHNFVLWPTHDG